MALQKGTQAVTGLITALLVSRLLSPAEQGFYYTLGSLMSGYVLLDLGLSSLITQKSAQYSLGLSLNPSNWSPREYKQGAQFLGLIIWTFKTYRRIACLALVLLLPAGAAFLGFSKQGSTFDWQLPWLVMTISVALSLPAQGFLALLEGTGAIRQTYTTRLLHYGLGAVLSWFLITIHQSLYALAMPTLLTALVVGWVYLRRYRAGLSRGLRLKEPLEWQGNLWTQQREVSALWILNYTVLNLPVLLSFSFGEIERAGQLGLSIVISNVFGALALSPLTAQIPRLIHQIECGERSLAKRGFIRGMLRFFMLYLVGSVFGILVLIMLQGHPFAWRVLPPESFAYLLLAFSAFHGFGASATYLRVSGNHRFAISYLLSALLLLLGCTYFQNRGVMGTLGILNIVLWTLALIALLKSYRPNSWLK